MASRALKIVSAVVVLCFITRTAFAENKPLPEFLFEFYTTEVQLTEVVEGVSVSATEYYEKTIAGGRGAVKMHFMDDLRSVFYDNSSYQITDINSTTCKVWDVDISDYDYMPIYFGWLNKDPLVIGPSAALWYGKSRPKDVEYLGKEAARDIMCDKYRLAVKNKYDDLTYDYYFAPEDWVTPYKLPNVRIPIRIYISGKSSRYSLSKTAVEVNQITDFAYFRPSLGDLNNLLPPIGIGCPLRKKTDYMPPIPKIFQYSAEVVDLLSTKKEDIEIQFQKTWYDQTRLLARRDTYTRKNGFRSNLYDFKTGTRYYRLRDGTCEMATLSDTDFQKYDNGMVRSMKTPAEALNLDGEFYEMGKREIRGLRCDTYESIDTDTPHFNGQAYNKLVVTAYFTEASTNVGVNGVTLSRIPVYYIITGWSTPTNKSLQLQYNIFAFDDVIWPEMYESFRLDRCYSKAESKAYFILVLEVESKASKMMEGVDEIFKAQLRSEIAKHAKVPEMRIPYLKVDYKSTGVFATGVMVERPPALLQFTPLDGPTETVTHDPLIKVIPEAENLEQCSYACVDEADFTCKGFYFCGRACFLKSTDPFEKEDPGKTETLGVCTEYIRSERQSTNFRQAYLNDALGNLETAVLNDSLPVAFVIPKKEIIVRVKDIVIGDGPYTGVDAGDKPFTLTDEFRKLDKTIETTKTVEYVGSLHECYKKCKDAGSLCSSFSFCPDSTKDNKECMISSTLVIKGITKDTELIPDKNCNIYNLKFADYFIPYPERVSLLPGDKVIRSVPALEKCAENCRLETDFKCRGFEFCRAMKTCTLHKKHILELKPGESGGNEGKQCVHYAARYIADYIDMGPVLIDDDSNVRYGTTLEECAKICSEDLKTDCSSFNFCPDDAGSTCSLSTKLLRQDGITTIEKKGCSHYEKRDIVHDWDNSKAKQLSPDGYTKKGFTGLVIGMLALGLVVGALGFVFYSYMRSRSSGDGMAVRFMKSDS